MREPSGGKVRLWPASLYGSLEELHVKGWIEEVEDARGGPMGSLWRDATTAGRPLHRSARFSAAAVLTRGPGIGASGAAFSALDAVVLRPPRFPEPDRVVHLAWDHGPGPVSWSSAVLHPSWKPISSRRFLASRSACDAIAVSRMPGPSGSRRIVLRSVGHRSSSMASR